jgi:hypothetical protein
MDQYVEDEAAPPGGCLLVSEASAPAIACRRWTVEQTARHVDVSEPMIRYGLNATGATRVPRGSRRRSSLPG